MGSLGRDSQLALGLTSTAPGYPARVVDPAACAIYQRWLMKERQRVVAVDVRSPRERWPETAPALLDGSMKVTADDLDELHDLWPDYWPSAAQIGWLRASEVS